MHEQRTIIISVKKVACGLSFCTLSIVFFSYITTMDGNSDKLGKLVTGSLSDHTKTIGIWAGFITSSLVVYFLFSSGDFSFLLTYAAFMRCFGFGLLNFKMWIYRSAKGVSLKTLELYALTFLVRLLSIMRHQGYLPYDKTGDWFYHVIEILSLLFAALAIYGMLGPLISTYEERYDKFGALHIPNEMGAAYCVLPCLVLAILFHPTLNKEWLSDTCWTYSMYLEVHIVTASSHCIVAAFSLHRNCPPRSDYSYSPSAVLRTLFF